MPAARSTVPDRCVGAQPARYPTVLPVRLCLAFVARHSIKAELLKRIKESLQK